MFLCYFYHVLWRFDVCHMVLMLRSAPNPIQSIRFSQIVPRFHSISTPYPFPYGFPPHWRALVTSRRSAGSRQRVPATGETALIRLPTKLSSWLYIFIRRDIERYFIDSLAAVKLDTAVYQTFKERWRDVARHVLGLNRTIRVGTGLTEMRKDSVLQHCNWCSYLAIKFILPRCVQKGWRCFFDERKRYWWAGCPLFCGKSRTTQIRAAESTKFQRLRLRLRLRLGKIDSDPNSDSSSDSDPHQSLFHMSKSNVLKQWYLLRNAFDAKYCWQTRQQSSVKVC